MISEAAVNSSTRCAFIMMTDAKTAWCAYSASLAK